jgi:hypothetical protein
MICDDGAVYASSVQDIHVRRVEKFAERIHHLVI